MDNVDSFDEKAEPSSVFPLSSALVLAHTDFRDCAHALIRCAQTYCC